MHKTRFDLHMGTELCVTKNGPNIFQTPARSDIQHFDTAAKLGDIVGQENRAEIALIARTVLRAQADSILTIRLGRDCGFPQSRVSIEPEKDLLPFAGTPNALKHL